MNVKKVVFLRLEFTDLYKMKEMEGRLSETLGGEACRQTGQEANNLERKVLYTVKSGSTIFFGFGEKESSGFWNSGLEPL